MPEFLKRRAMYYVCKLIDGDCDYDNCVMDVEELIKVDALLKERIPEIIEDMCMGMENQYGIDLIGKYIENSMPVITKFCKVVSDHGKDKNYIGTALCYLYCKLNNKRLSLICNTCFCGYGEAIKAEDIITVEVLEKN